MGTAAMAVCNRVTPAAAAAMCVCSSSGNSGPASISFDGVGASAQWRCSTGLAACAGPLVRPVVGFGSQEMMEARPMPARDQRKAATATEGATASGVSATAASGSLRIARRGAPQILAARNVAKMATQSRAARRMDIGGGKGPADFRIKGSSEDSKSRSSSSSSRKMGDEDPWRIDAYGDIPNQAESVTAASATLPQPEYRSAPDIEYLQELLAMQQSGPKSIGFFGTRNMGFMHQQLIEILSYAMVITKNHIYTSGASGTNAAVIRGALRAERPDLLTVILPQSLKRQPPESQELLSKVQNVVEMPQNDSLPLFEASRLCNMDILSHVQQVICFAFHDSNLLMETCREAKNLRKIVTLFYLD